MKRKIKVLIVDDSPVFRALLNEILSSDPFIEVIAMAQDPYEARSLIKQHNPDVLTLDIEMPKMNGVQFLKNLMRLRPMPVVMISTLTQHGAEPTLAALELGAVDYIPKPQQDSTADLLSYKSQVIEKIKMAAMVNLSSQAFATESATLKHSEHNVEVIAIGASTGGTEAVKTVLSALPRGMPPIVVTQHISRLFSSPFAERLNGSSVLTVLELPQGETKLRHNHVYIAPGDQHMVVFKRHGQLLAHLDDSSPVNRHKPSVDVMFNSVAESCKQYSVGVILTGMGNDGARGLQKMKQYGAVTLAQDESTSVVWGMPRVAIELQAADWVEPLNKIPQFLCDQLSS